MKTFDKKDIYSWSNAEEAEQYIHKEGYFTDVYSDDLNNWDEDILININKKRKTDEIFESANYLRGLFLPADKVKEVEEKKWRAFKDYQEFTTWTKKSVGDVIYFRTRNNKEENYISLIISFISLTKVIIIGKDYFSLFQLFNDYEWLDDKNEWKPFGVIDEA